MKHTTGQVKPALEASLLFITGILVRALGNGSEDQSAVPRTG